MEKARKKLRVCLICVVAVALVLGAVYYLYELNGNYGVNEGTLIMIRSNLSGLVGGQ